MELLAECEVLEDQFVVAAAGQGERSRDPEDGSRHGVIVSCETGEIDTAQGPDPFLATDRRDGAVRRGREGDTGDRGAALLSGGWVSVLRWPPP
jgi:hypothetical protein